MSKNWELIGHDVLVTERTGISGGNKRVGIRLSSVTRWQEYFGDLSRTTIWLNDGGEMTIGVPFEEFTRIVAMPLRASLDD